MNRFDVIISGAGIPGLTLALRLAQAGLKVALIDYGTLPTSKSIKPSSHTAALMADTIATLEDLGVWSPCEKHSEALETLTIIDNNGKTPVEASFHANEIDKDYFGKNIANNVLKAALSDVVKTHKAITLYENTSLEKIVENNAHHITVNIRDNVAISAKLLVGADGRNSVTRDLAGIKAWRQDYGQCALTCVITHDKSHHNTSTEFHRPGGPFTLVPMPGKVSSVVWVEKTADAERLIKLSKQDFEAALQRESCDILGHIKLELSPSIFPLQALKAKSFTAPRIALMAEAAHVITPLGAQGLNLSLRDAESLYNTIYDAAKLGQDIGSGATLHSYEKTREIDVKARVFGTHGLNKLVSNHSALLRHVRHSGLRALGTNSVLRRMAMQLGMTGEAFSSAPRGNKSKTG